MTIADKEGEAVFVGILSYHLSESNYEGEYSTVVIAYKNIVGSREKCSYNRYVLITDTFLLRMDRNGSQAMVLKADMFL